jgi:hypothetical protein
LLDTDKPATVVKNLLLLQWQTKHQQQHQREEEADSVVDAEEVVEEAAVAVTDLVKIPSGSQ